MSTTSTTRTYGAHWEKPEWIYDQALKVEKRIQEPDMLALKAKSAALFQQSMAKEFPEFFSHYTKIFFRAINGQINGPAFLMLLKQRQKMDRGEISWVDGNNEVIGAAFSLLCRQFPEDLKEKVMATYRDLVDEEKEELRTKVEEILGTGGGGEEDSDKNAKIESLLGTLGKAPPQRIEVVDGGDSTEILPQ